MGQGLRSPSITSVKIVLSSRLIVLHPKQNIESDLKCQTYFCTMPSKFSCSAAKRQSYLGTPEAVADHFASTLSSV